MLFNKNNNNYDHWNENVFILMKFSSLAALKVVKMTTSSAASDENFVKRRHFRFSDVKINNNNNHKNKKEENCSKW